MTRALQHLYQSYEKPLYGYLRRRGLSEDDARDLLQSFYAHLIAKRAVERLERSGGRLRAYLITALKNFASNEVSRAAARKRSPERPLLSLDSLLDEGKEAGEGGDSPLAIYERRWAETLAERAVSELGEQERLAGRSSLFDALHGHVLGGAGPSSYQEIAERFGLSVGAVKVRVHRYRRSLGAILRRELARTVSDPCAIDDELRHLLGRLAEGHG